LADRLRSFSEALLDSEAPLPRGLVGPDGEASPKRFAVYRNNVVIGLTEALRANFPATCRIVGDEFFSAMARAYVASARRTSPVLLDYGVGFPDFIATFEPATELPYLADVARIERAWTEAYHALEARPIEPSAFASVAPDRLVDIHLVLHPSLRVVRSPLPALTIWRMNVEDGVPCPVDLASGGEDALVMRPDANVEVRSLPAGAADFVAALAAGQSVTEAMRAATAAHRLFDLAANLTGLMAARAFTGFTIAKEEDRGKRRFA